MSHFHSVHSRTLIDSADINECELDMHTCNSNANCTDTEGSFNCTCGEGFEGNGFNCTGTRCILHKHHYIHAHCICMHMKSIQSIKMKPKRTCCTHLFGDYLYLLLCRHFRV